MYVQNVNNNLAWCLNKNLLGQTRIWIRVAVGAADGHVVRDTIARQTRVFVSGRDIGRGRFAVFLRASDFAGETVARVTIHHKRGSVI